MLIARNDRAINVAGLITEEAVHRDVYADPQVFQLELERLFARSWVFMGHESQIPNKGDYFLASVATESTIIVRDSAGEIHAFLNSCPHRGAPLKTDPRGSATRFVCPYHSWTFKTNGELVGMPLRNEYPDSFDWSDHCLKEVGQVATYRGFIFVSKNPVTDLKTFLGGLAQALDDLIDRAPDQEIEAQPVVQRHVYRGNWKLYLENLNDSLHFTSTHASAATALQQVEDKSRLSQEMMAGAVAPTPEQMRDNTMVRYYPYGHSYTGGFVQMGGSAPGAGDPLYDAIAAKRGDEEARRIMGTNRHLSLLYPSASINTRMSTIRIVRPLSVDRTEIIALLFRLKGAPEQTYRTTVFYNWASGSPSSFALADDIEMFERMQRIYENSHQEWNSIHRFSGTTPGETDGELVISGTSEEYIRNQFTAWSELMAEEVQ